MQKVGEDEGISVSKTGIIGTSPRTSSRHFNSREEYLDSAASIFVSPSSPLEEDSGNRSDPDLLDTQARTTRDNSPSVRAREEDSASANSDFDFGSLFSSPPRSEEGFDDTADSPMVADLPQIESEDRPNSNMDSTPPSSTPTKRGVKRNSANSSSSFTFPSSCTPASSSPKRARRDETVAQPGPTSSSAEKTYKPYRELPPGIPSLVLPPSQINRKTNFDPRGGVRERTVIITCDNEQPVIKRMTDSEADQRFVEMMRLSEPKPVQKFKFGEEQNPEENAEQTPEVSDGQMSEKRRGKMCASNPVCSEEPWKTEKSPAKIRLKGPKRSKYLIDRG